MSSAINSSDQKAFNLGLPEGVTGPGIQENNRLESQDDFGRSVKTYEQLQERTNVQDQRFFDPIADFVQPTSVYLIPRS